MLRHEYPELADCDRFGRVTIGDNCHIGMKTMILPGVTIGRDCIVGACAVVTHDIPDGTVVAGIPARAICTVEEYRDKHANELLMTKHMSCDESLPTSRLACTNDRTTRWNTPMQAVTEKVMHKAARAAALPRPHVRHPRVGA